MSVLKGKDLSAYQGNQLIFAGLSFDVTAGQPLQVTGPNGCGKSTLLRGIAGLHAFSDGDVLIDEKPWKRDSLLYLDHRTALKPMLSVGANLQHWWCALKGNMADLPAAMQKWGVAGLEDIEIGQLSLGQQRRVQLVLLECGSKDIWVLDETSHGLDQAGQDLLLKTLTSHPGVLILAAHAQMFDNQLDLQEYAPHASVVTASL
ncbi:MAG: heme ABC exporter ATP-binding protein CcmA [Alphaproteobacteria bacterium]